MATVKIDRQPAVSQPKVVEQTSAPAPVAKVEEVKSTEPESLFGVRSKALDPVTGPDGKPTAKSADARELFQNKSFMSDKPPLSALVLKNLTPEQAKTKMAELQTKKAELETKIDGRAQELDQKWSRMRLCHRADALRGYMADSNSMSTEVKTNLQAALDKQDAVQAKIDGLAAQAKQNESPKDSDDRKALAAQLRAARRESSAAVKEATSTVDDAGLHIERLVMTEAKIDPTMGQNSKFGNMGALVGQYFETTFMMDTLNRLFMNPVVALTKEMDREQKEAVKRAAIEDRWRERDNMMRDLLKDISAKDVNQKRDLNDRVVKASRSGDVAKMNSTDIAKLERKRT
jgi:hypothetical protein